MRYSNEDLQATSVAFVFRGFMTWFWVPITFMKVLKLYLSMVTDGGALLTFGWGLYGQVSK